MSDIRMQHLNNIIKGHINNEMETIINDNSDENQEFDKSTNENIWNF